MDLTSILAPPFELDMAGLSDIESAICYSISTDTDLQALIPGTGGFYYLELPQEGGIPSIVYQRIAT